MGAVGDDRHAWVFAGVCPFDRGERAAAVLYPGALPVEAVLALLGAIVLQLDPDAFRRSAAAPSRSADTAPLDLAHSGSETQSSRLHCATLGVT
jgi:hypothetical protein